MNKVILVRTRGEVTKQQEHLSNLLSCEYPSLVYNSPMHTQYKYTNAHFPCCEEVPVTGAQYQSFKVQPHTHSVITSQAWSALLTTQ